MLLLATMAFHAFFGLSLDDRHRGCCSPTGTARWVAPGALPPLADQQAAGGIAWSVGEIPTVILAISSRSSGTEADTRDAKRQDRAADRDGDAELAAYNAMLEERWSAD